jgi:carbonic anhydrase
MTPEKALQFLREGNQRFVNNLKANRNLLQQINETKDGQFPFATILSCIDSRTSAELVFDQGLGDIFSIRIAGNFVNEDILGSMEFGCKIAGSKILVVLGHSQCGAIKGACDNVSLGKLTALIQKLRPAVRAVTGLPGERCSQNAEFVQAVAQKNVHLTVAEILERSPILREMNQKKEIGIVGGLHDIETGQITFFGYRQDEVRGELRCPLGWSCSVIVPIRRFDSSLAD